MTFQYESKVWHNTSKASVASVAEQLLGLLQTKRRALGSDGPIVFVVHSLGGIIIKQAISTANDIHNQTFRDIADATRGIVFFGTPHRGSDAAKTLDPVHKITAVGWTRMRFLSLLTPHSHELRDISDDFRHVAQRYALVTFYEQHIHPGLRDLIVDKASSVMGIAHEDIMMLGGNHSSMCKFFQDDPRFDTVWMAIESAAKGLAVRGQAPAAPA
ncbi:Alpha/Beta hydrolase protein [Apiosordaria backusii]|uniref:Alpha/Beta hydrolase protein n=1 Tax=Apiosordaria backusii TaxID=314023 RepID=A0AA40AIP4_9PEZI|nr:Alpha/Beta hydrolase protein [Apiosordaria backusii]